MHVHFRQIYIEPGVSFPFSHHFQNRLAKTITSMIAPSAKYLEKYGGDFDLTFNVSAKTAIADNEIRGPAVFRKTKDVEYTVFLPYEVITRHVHAPKHALTFLVRAVCRVFDMLEIDNSKVIAAQDSIIDGICSDPTTLRGPSWDDAQNKAGGWSLFRAFFNKNCGVQ
jgi:hypothetical protein